jgi:hypothetical protein
MNRSITTPSIEDGLRHLKEKGYVVFLYSGDLSDAAQDAATNAIEDALGLPRSRPRQSRVSLVE